MFTQYRPSESVQNEKPWIVYTDGSYSSKASGYVSGAFLVFNENTGERWKWLNYSTKQSLVDSCNVGAELFAALASIHWSYKQGCRNIVLMCDYNGIIEWVKGNWTANCSPAQVYVREVKRYINLGMNITFKKVKAHQYDKWNNYVDFIAQWQTARIIEGDFETLAEFRKQH